MLLERVEVNLVKNAPYYKKAEVVNDLLLIYVIAKFQRSKWKDLWNLAEIEITEGYGNFSNSVNMNRP